MFREYNPPPAPATGDVWREIIDGWARWIPRGLRARMMVRRDFGIQKYGTPLQRDNQRDHRLDAEEEALDLVAYLHAGHAPWWLRVPAVALLWAVWAWRRRVVGP